LAFLLVAALFAPTAVFGADETDQIFNNLEWGFRAHREARYDEAIDYYTKVIRARTLAPRDRAVTFLLRGESYRENDEPERAILDFVRATKIKPNYAQAYYFKGLAYQERGKLAEAYQNIRAALSYQPDNEMYQHKLDLVAAKLEAAGKKIPE
jgi:tetratricopeptide (TPR) repeat protein